MTVGDKLLPKQENYGNLDPGPIQATERLENGTHWKGVRWRGRDLSDPIGC